jgi:formylglycine-generating enzyme required for sulfatase activity/energy-coupling factor transporter ATP-binding protein EcfA2
MLTRDQVLTLVDLLVPLVGTENSRLSVIGLAFAGAGNTPSIDVSGAATEFARRLVVSLQTYRLDTGEPALWALRQAIYNQIGQEQQKQFDALEKEIFAAVAPAANYVIVAEGNKSLFISYSRQDSKFVERLRADLQAADFNLWIDRKGLKVGQKNWEREIRKALTTADAVVYVGSPHASDSNYVGAEITIAEAKYKPIFCVWAAGELWADSAPLSLVKAQYADLRNNSYNDGLAELIVSLHGEVVETPIIEPVTPETPSPPPPDFQPRNPYKGLEAFDATDRQRFFGREAFIEAILTRLRTELRFLAVIGASGSGKSSVIMAGLLPRLTDGDVIPGSREWRILDPLRPGELPLEGLTDQLGQHLPQLLPVDIRRELDDESARGLLRLARRITSSRLVVYIDQFEEVFTLTEKEAERRQFIDLITTAANEPASPVTILLTMRADFYDRPLAYGELGELISRRAVPILPMSITELFDAVRKPAALDEARLTFEEGLTEELVFAVSDQPGALPLLQFALEKLYEHRDGFQLTWKAYKALKGVHGALANYAESTYNGLSSEEKFLARALFLRLIELGTTEQDTTRRCTPLSELAYSNAKQTEAMAGTISKFVKARLLIKDQMGGNETVEVSHEALIREWERLRGWLYEAREDVLLRKRIAVDADEWARNGQPQEALYRGRRLREVQNWARNNVASAYETAFIEASEEAEKTQIAEEEQRLYKLAVAETQARQSAEHAEQQRRRAVRFGCGAALIGLVAFVLFLVALWALSSTIQLKNIESTAVAGAMTANIWAAQAESTQRVAERVARDALTQVANFRIEQAYVSTLSAGAVVIPLGTLTPEILIPTLTGVAQLNNWQPHVITEEVEGVQIEMVEVPAGCFIMGSNATGNAQPVNEQCFDEGFYIDRYEVTQAQFTALEGRVLEDFRFPGENRPVENINWFEARDYCKARDARLPTEREWEYAARGPDSLSYPWGNTYIAESVIYNRVETQGTGTVIDEFGNPMRPSGASWVGALDMAGNVYEWTSTRYDDIDYSDGIFNFQYNFPYPYTMDDGREADEALNEYEDRAPIITVRAIRGGAWSYFESDIRSASRGWSPATYRDYRIGFRCARSY